MRSLWFELLRRRDLVTSFRRPKKITLINKKNNYYVLVHKNAQQILALQFKKIKMNNFQVPMTTYFCKKNNRNQ